MLSLTLPTDSATGALLDLAITFVACVHVFISPYSKVEESFNLHATHDILAYGVTPTALPNYDHFTFPGVVPRTFIGSLLLAAGSYLPLRIGTALGFIQSKLDVQILIRLVLILFNVCGLSQIRWAVQKRFGVATAVLFVVLTCTQFHLPFWIGRTLPNMFALMPVNLATSLFVYPGSTPIVVQRHYRAILCLVGSAAIIFRSELVLLAVPLLGVVLFQHAIPLSFLVPFGTIIAIGSIICTVLVDSYFWNTWSPPMWPEFLGIVFNVYEGKSSEWGTSPWHAYLSHHLPKLLLASAPLAAFACVPLPAGITSSYDRKHVPAIARQLLAPSVAFTLLISGLAHKEWRFIVYVVPVVNVVAAIGARRLLELNSKPLRILARLAVLGLIGCNIIATTVLTTISRANYPGGAALALVNAQPDQQASVWIDNLAAQTGASLFTQDHSTPYFFSNSTQEWTYSKDPSPVSYDAFTYLVTETPGAFPKDRWTAIGHVDAFDRIDLKRGVLVTKPALFVLQNHRL